MSVSRNEVMCFLMNDESYQFLGNEFSDGNMCNHLIKFVQGHDYLMGMFVYSTAVTIALQKFTRHGVSTLFSKSFVMDNNFKVSYHKIFEEFMFNLKNICINKRLKDMEKDFNE